MTNELSSIKLASNSFASQPKIQPHIELRFITSIFYRRSN